MRPNRLSLIALALILAIVWISGAHFHLSHHDHEVGQETASAEIVAEDEDAPDHIAAHLLHGDVDIDSAAKAIGKGPVLPLPVFALAYILAFVLPPPVSSVCGAERPFRPPAWQDWPHLLPPSQAPPSQV